MRVKLEGWPPNPRAPTSPCVTGVVLPQPLGLASLLRHAWAQGGAMLAPVLGFKPSKILEVYLAPALPDDMPRSAPPPPPPPPIYRHGRYGVVAAPAKPYLSVLPYSAVDSLLPVYKTMFTKKAAVFQQTWRTKAYQGVHVARPAAASAGNTGSCCYCHNQLTSRCLVAASWHGQGVCPPWHSKCPVSQFRTVAAVRGELVAALRQPRSGCQPWQRSMVYRGPIQRNTTETEGARASAAATDGAVVLRRLA